MRTRITNILLVLTATIFFAQVASSQASANTKVNFKNNGRTPVKLCLYTDAEKTYPFAFRCLTLAPGASQTWDQEDIKQFDIFAFDPGIIDALRCSFKGVAGAGLVEVFEKNTDGRCIQPTARTVIVKPPPKPLPPGLPPSETLRVCNTSINEAVYFAITFALGQTNHMTEGWWSVGKGECTNVDLTERWRLQGLPTGFRYKTYIYGETAGTLGGALKKVWEGDDPKFAFCIDDPKEKRFANKQTDVSDGVVWETDCSATAAKRMVKMWPIEIPKTGEQWKWNF